MQPQRKRQLRGETHRHCPEPTVIWMLNFKDSRQIWYLRLETGVNCVCVCVCAVWHRPVSTALALCPNCHVINKEPVSLNFPTGMHSNSKQRFS